MRPKSSLNILHYQQYNIIKTAITSVRFTVGDQYLLNALE